MKILTMDPSNRISYILGDNIRVDTSEMTPNDWLAIFERILKFNKPHLKYLGFKEIEKFMNGQEFAGSRIPTGETLSNTTTINFSDGIISTTRCIFICELKVEFRKGIPTPKPFVRLRLHNEVHTILAEILLFSTKGDFIAWNVGYIRSLKDNCQLPITPGDIISTMTHSLFSILSNEELASLISRHPHIGKEFIKMISIATTHSISRQRERLGKSEIMEKELQTIEKKLG